MVTNRFQLIDPSGAVVATGEAVLKEGQFRGRADVGSMPASVRAVFAEYENIVNQQMFSLIDEIERKVLALSLKVVFPNSPATRVEDLQIYPSTGRVSFRVPRSAAAQPVPKV
jgi:hypothetical protein